MTKEAKLKRLKVARIVLIFWTLFIGVGAIFGASWMLADTTGKAMGMDSLLPYFQVLPFADTLFTNFLFSGLMLLLVNGLTNITAAVFLFLKKKIGYILGTIFGITLMLWIVIQFIILPSNFLSTIYFDFGILQFLTGVTCLIFYEQCTFEFNVADYTKIKDESDVLVLYFSRMGYCRKIAYQLADDYKAKIVEITTEEKIQNTSGFWWSGFSGMNRKKMKTRDLDIDLSKYEKIIIVSPIWVFRICAPIRDFMDKYKEKINNPVIVLNHYCGRVSKPAIEEIRTYFKSFEIISYQTKWRKITKQKKF